MPEAIGPLKRFPGSLLKIHILGSTSEIPILESLIFLCSTPSDPDAWQVWLGTAVSPGPGTVAQSTEGLEETHAEWQHGSDLGAQLLRPLPGVRMASGGGGIWVGP